MDVAATSLLLACAPLSARAEGGTDAAATRARRDEADPCTDVDVFAVFPKRPGRRGDARALRPDYAQRQRWAPGAGTSGTSSASAPPSTTRKSSSFCLPTVRKKIASGNAMRGSAFDAVHRLRGLARVLQHDPVQRLSDCSRSAACGEGRPRARCEWRRERDAPSSALRRGPTSDARHTYELHGRARFDTRGRNPAGPARSRPARRSSRRRLDAGNAEWPRWQ